MNKLLAAYTALQGPYPPYLNFSLDNETDEVVVTLRETPLQGGEHNHLMNGNTAQMRMPVGEFWCMWREAMRNLGRELPAVEQS